jgi:sugar/nucleoside kinase (ribokinase family)
MTHLGVIDTFKASDTVLHELVNCRSADPSFVNHHHHIHIAGYYNLKLFQDGNLKRRLKLVREKRRAKSHNGNIFTTTTSLVPQYDATEKWDGGLMEDVLPLVDFLILNALEAGKISGIVIDDKDCGGDLSRTVTLTKLADFFFEKSPLTHVIVTLGSLGAVCLYQGEVVISMKCPKRYRHPVDPTGAGDAFSAGFLFGVMHWRKSRNHQEFAEIGSLLEGSWTEAIVEGMKFGCAAGTACVAKPGASVPASKGEIEELLRMVEEEEEYQDDYEDGDDGHGDEEDDDDDDDDEDYYDSDESYDDDSDYSDYSHSHSDSCYSSNDDGDDVYVREEKKGD